jgi:2-(1,2-epoxy-1,2-dihydrophenyl)acetyl-CoA isomerase
MPKPVIAAVNGLAAGIGLSIALACDMIVASENAGFCGISIKRGLISSGCVTYFLPHLIGLHRAKEMLFLGEVIGARDAERLGLVNHVYPTYEFRAKVKELAEKLAKGPPKALAFQKKLANDSLISTMEAAGPAEDQVQRILFQSEDFKEGMQSLIEYREAKFSGK